MGGQWMIGVDTGDGHGQMGGMGWQWIIQMDGSEPVKWKSWQVWTVNQSNGWQRLSMITQGACVARSTITADWVQHSSWNVTTSWQELVIFNNRLSDTVITQGTNTPCMQTLQPGSSRHPISDDFNFLTWATLAPLSVDMHMSRQYGPGSWWQLSQDSHY